MSEAASDHPLDQAIEAVDRALAHRPKIDGYAFTDATKAVCAYRDGIRFGLRENRANPGDEQRLQDSNLAITLLLSGHFALGEIPWKAVEDLRGHLVAMRAGAA